MVGFLNTFNNVNENDGQVNIQIGGLLQRPVVVEFSTDAVSATGKFHSITLQH